MNVAHSLREQQAAVAVVQPQSVNNTTKDSDWVDMGVYRRVIFYLSVGVTDCTVDAQLQSATDSSGTGAAFISGKSITQISAVGDNRVVAVEIRSEEVAALGATRQYVRLRVTVSNATAALIAVLGIAEVARFEPATDFATLAESIG